MYNILQRFQRQCFKTESYKPEVNQYMDDKITYNNHLTKELVNYLHYQIENNPNVIPYNIV